MTRFSWRKYRPGKREEIMVRAKVSSEVELFKRLGIAFGTTAQEVGISLVAIDWLTRPKGRETLRRIVRSAEEDWRAAQLERSNRKSKPSQLVLPPNHYVVPVTYALSLSDSVPEGEYEKLVPTLFDPRKWTYRNKTSEIDHSVGERLMWVAKSRPRQVKDWGSLDICSWAECQKSELAPKGWRTATHEELIEFARIHPPLKRGVCIVALSSYRSFGDSAYQLVAVLDATGVLLSYDLGQFPNEKWPARYYFLLVAN